MKDGVYIERKGRTYRVIQHTECTRRTCSLFKAGVCDGNETAPLRLPCDNLSAMLCKAGMDLYDCNFKEVKKQ